jgi:hypothetical protein
MRARVTEQVRKRGTARIVLRVGLAIATLLVVMVALGGAPQSSALVSHPARASGSAGPARERGVRPGIRDSSGAFTSRNWDGYITYDSSEGTDFDTVKATWTQPTVTCPKPDAWTVFWVGLDGWWNDTVEQGGSSAQCVNGVPQYTTWWEMYPTYAIVSMFTIHAGDKITAKVTYKTIMATFVIAVTDLTTGKSFTEDKQCASNITCDRSSADVIAEDVGTFGNSYYPLADYGTMKFEAASVSDVNGHSGGIVDAHWLNAGVTEKSDGETYATISGLNAQGDAFKATWKSV